MSAFVPDAARPWTIAPAVAAAARAAFPGAMARVDRTGRGLAVCDAPRRGVRGTLPEGLRAEDSDGLLRVDLAAAAYRALGGDGVWTGRWPETANDSPAWLRARALASAMLARPYGGEPASESLLRALLLSLCRDGRAAAETLARAEAVYLRAGGPDPRAGAALLAAWLSARGEGPLWPHPAAKARE